MDEQTNLLKEYLRGEKDGRTVRTSVRKLHILQDTVPFAAAAQKERGKVKRNVGRVERVKR